MQAERGSGRQVGRGRQVHGEDTVARVLPALYCRQGAQGRAELTGVATPELENMYCLGRRVAGWTSLGSS